MSKMVFFEEYPVILDYVFGGLYYKNFSLLQRLNLLQRLKMIYSEIKYKYKMLLLCSYKTGLS